MEAATTEQPTPPQQGVSSFAKSLFLGEIHEDLVFPYPQPDDDEQRRIRELVLSCREFGEHYDQRAVEERRWIGDDEIASWASAGCWGCTCPRSTAAQGLSQTGYCRVSEEFAQIDATLSVIMGVHQSIGMKGIVLFGTDEQKARFLPDLASGRKLAGFALTEPNAGSDAYNLESRAVRQPDGSWRLNGEKRYIGNGSKGSVFVTFARTEIDGEDRHTAFILEKGMDGFEVGQRYDTMGLRGNDLRQLHFKDVRIPPENVLGEPGEGFRIAMHILNNGRLGLGTGSVGGAKVAARPVIDHVKERRQFGRPLADFELVQEKIGWMVSYLFGLESMAYLTTGLVDAGVPDYSLESAICKVSGHRVPVVRGQPRAPAQGRRGLHARRALREDAARHPHLPDLRGRQRRDARVHRAVGDEAGGRGAQGAGGREPRRPDRLDRRAGRLRGRADPARGAARPDHEGPRRADGLAAPVADQVKRLRSVTESLLREHKGEIVERQFQQKRLADAVADIYAQIAVLSRVTSIFDEQGVEPSGQERYIAETFCPRAAGRVNAASTRSSRTTTSG